MPNYDAIIIGTGQSGPALARRLVAAGRNVAIIERNLFGGTCVNTGCTPTKTLVASAYAAHNARRAADYGVRIEGSIDVDIGRDFAALRFGRFWPRLCEKSHGCYDSFFKSAGGSDECQALWKG